MTKMGVLISACLAVSLLSTDWGSASAQTLPNYSEPQIKSDSIGSYASQSRRNRNENLCENRCRRLTNKVSRSRCFCECAGGIWHPGSRLCE